MQRRLRFFLVLTLAALGAALPPGLWGQVDCISGVVFEDNNNNGVFDVAGDTLLEGIPVNLIGPGGAITVVLSDINGLYEACDLPSGAYTVSIGSNSPYQITPSEYMLDLLAGQSLTGNDFALFPFSNLSVIEGHLYYDLNDNQIREVDEPGIPGVTVTLTGTSGSSTVTDLDGGYRFTDLETGDYTITADVVPNATLLSQPNLSVAALGGDFLGGNDFRYSPAVGRFIILDFVCIDFDGNGQIDSSFEPGIGGVKIDLTDTMGNVISTVQANPSGLYAFDGLTPGSYNVSMDTAQVPDYQPITPIDYSVTVANAPFVRISPFYFEPRRPIFNCGQSFVTCFSGFNGSTSSSGVNINAPVMGRVEVRPHNTAPTGQNWPAASSTIYHPDNWTAAKLGQVFGTAIDDNYNVYVASTSIYGCQNDSFDPAGPAGMGGIYRINEFGQVFTYISTGPFSVGGSTIPNSGSGLGNICYDETNSQFFVTNMADGMIYRIRNGQVLSRFDPFTTTNTSDSRFVVLGERTWGVAYNPLDNRVYFSRWVEDRGRPNNGATNEVYSIELNAGEFNATNNDGSGTFWGGENIEITGTQLPQFKIGPTSTTQTYSNPISDISFSYSGRMLIGERTMSSDCGGALTNNWNGYAHSSRVLEYERTGGTGPWALTPGHNAPYDNTNLKFRIGQANLGSNCAGGIDYGKEAFLPGETEAECDSMIWSSGDYLSPQPSNNPCGVSMMWWLYGLQGTRSTGGTNANSVLIDLDNDLCRHDKLLLGDVEVFDCACSVDCAQLGLSTRAVPQDSITADSCCYVIDYSNSGTENVYGLQFQALDGVQINHPHLVNSGEEYTLAAGFQVGNYNNSLLEVIPVGGGIMPAMSNGLITNLCPKNVLAFPQYVLVNYLDENYEPFCTDTLILSCPIEETCLFIVSDTLVCDSLGYKYTATVKNPSGADFPVGYIKLNIEPDIPGLTVLEGEGIVLTDTLQQGDTTTLMWTLVTSDDLYGDSLCFILSAHDGIEERLCCAEIDTCIAFPPCDPCKFVDAMVKPLADDQVGECCFELFVTDTFTYAPALFQSIQANILNAGVYFTGVDALPAQIDGWSVAPPLPLPANTQSLLWTHSSGITPNGVGYNLFDFCIEGTTTTDSVYVEINWLDADGMVACSDTVAVFCPDCLNVVNDTLSCRTTDTPTGVTEEYVYTFQVVNYSPFDVNTIGIVEIPSNNTSISPDVITIPTIPAFPPGGTSVPVSIVIDGSVGSDTTLCFDIVLRQVIADSIDIVCCYATHCVYLPPCDSLPPFLCPDPGLVSQDPCPLVWDPVCGCDDRTYSNICFAINAGITLWSPGVCDTVQNADPRVVLSGSAGVNGEVLLEWMLDDDPARYSHFVLRNWPAGGGTPLTVAVLPVLPGQQQYNFMDLNAGMGIQEYDVVAVGLDGLPIFSNIVQVMRMNGAQRGAMIYAYPVPAANTLNITSNRQGEAVVELMSADGRTLMQRQESFQGLPVPVDVSGIGSGVYLVRLRFRSGEVGQQRVVKME